MMARPLSPAKPFLRHTLLALSLSCMMIPGVAMAAQGAPEVQDRPGQSRYTNRLINSADPYLLLHAHNPVDWYPWGPEALARAKKENKPIFLSIGYSTCYWCHVAEKKLYSHPEIAALMNPWFVNIKVDREQLPDLDRIYMLATELMTGQGGWPNNVFLTPDLKPFYAGSYFGPTDGDLGRPGFPTVLKGIHKAWTTDEQRVRDSAERVFQAMRQIEKGAGAGRAGALRPADWLVASRAALARAFDPEHGGFPGGNGTKFPREPVLRLLLTDSRVNHSADSLRMLEKTMDAMALGGVYDQLAGGFHRYSTEPTWSIPHFEKMLYDNAQLLALYAQLYKVAHNPLYKRIAMGLRDYLTGQMFSREGGFYSAQDAEVDGDEGASYVWTRSEIVSVVGPEAAERFFEMYDLTPMPGLPGRKLTFAERPGVLRVRAELIQKSGARIVDALNGVSALRAKLLDARNRRRQPLRDEKIVVGINGLAIDAFVRTRQVFDDDGALEVATRTAERIWARAYDPKTHRLMHEIFHGLAQTPGYLEDYALLASGCMSLYDATKNAVWLDRAKALAGDIERQFLHDDGRLSTSPNERALLIVPEDDGDDVYPSGTSAAVDLLLRLNAVTAEPRYSSLAERIVRYVVGGVREHPDSWGAMVASVSAHEQATRPTGRERAARTSPSAKGLGLPATADHVRVTASTAAKDGHDEIVTTLHIDDGWHVNANPASFDYLVPTSVAFEGLSATQVIYPKAVRITPQFAPNGLDVYTGVANLVALFPTGTLARAAGIRGTLTVQACSDQVCLPPAKIQVVPDGTGSGRAR